MEPLKVVIFVVAFLLLLVLGRKLSTLSESTIVTAPPQPDADNRVVAPVSSATGKQPALVGADLPFPVQVPEIARDPDGRYNRPEFLNYHFENTDLVRGPENPDSFYDDFYLLVRDVENDHTSMYKYFVATPAGLRKAMDEERVPVLYLEQQAIIIARWDVPLILETIVKDMMKAYADKKDDPEAHALPGD